MNKQWNKYFRSNQSHLNFDETFIILLSSITWRCSWPAVTLARFLSTVLFPLIFHSRGVYWFIARQLLQTIQCFIANYEAWRRVDHAAHFQKAEEKVSLIAFCRCIPCLIKVMQLNNIFVNEQGRSLISLSAWRFVVYL